MPNSRRSDAITKGPARAPARAMLRGAGYSDEDLARPLIAVVNTWSTITPCNLHLGALAEPVRKGIRNGGGTPGPGAAGAAPAKRDKGSDPFLHNLPPVRSFNNHISQGFDDRRNNVHHQYIYRNRSFREILRQLRRLLMTVAHRPYKIWCN